MKKNVIFISAIKYNRTEAASKVEAIINNRRDKLLKLAVAIKKAYDAAKQAEEQVELAESELNKLAAEIADVKVAKGKGYRSTVAYREVNARYIIADEIENRARQTATEKKEAINVAKANYRRAARHTPKWRLQPVEFVGKCGGNYKFASK